MTRTRVVKAGLLIGLGLVLASCQTSGGSSGAAATGAAASSQVASPNDPSSCFGQSFAVVLKGAFVKSGNAHCLGYAQSGATGTYCTEDKNYRGCHPVVLSRVSGDVIAKMGELSTVWVDGFKARTTVRFVNVDDAAMRHDYALESGKIGFNLTWEDVRADPV